MRRKRRNHSAAFKAKVALAALKGDKHAVRVNYFQRDKGLVTCFIILSNLEDQGGPQIDHGDP